MTDEAAIRELITGWAVAVRTGDPETLLANQDSVHRRLS
jgi:ketosteroid isomerase-like protein